MNRSVLLATIAFASVVFNSADARPPFRIYNDAPVQRVYASQRVVRVPVATSRRVVSAPQVVGPMAVGPRVVSPRVISPAVGSPIQHDIRSMHILDRPNRVGHFYGNTVRRLHYYGQLLPRSGRR